MIHRISRIDGFDPLHRFDSRLERLKQHLDRNDRIEFRYRSRKLTGRVVELHRRAVVVSFELNGKEITKPVTYGSVLKVLNR